MNRYPLLAVAVISQLAQLAVQLASSDWELKALGKCWCLHR